MDNPKIANEIYDKICSEYGFSPRASKSADVAAGNNADVEK